MAIKNFTTYRQLDAMDCGPTCIRMILKYYGKIIKSENLKSAAQLGTTGVSLLGLSEAAEKYGLRTISARLTFDQLLTEASLPCIIHWDQYHFVVVTPYVNKKKITIADPARGLITFSKQESLTHWLSITRAC
jgi:ATP-binding cassette subfamily B protein